MEYSHKKDKRCEWSIQTKDIVLTISKKEDARISKLFIELFPDIVSRKLWREMIMRSDKIIIKLR